MGDIRNDVQVLDKPENFELRQRKPSPSPSPEKGGFLDPNISAEEQHRLSTSEDPPATYTSDSSLASFRSLIATNTASGNIKLSPSSTPDTVLFYVKNGSLHRNTPSTVISFENKEGPVIGTLKLGWGRNNTFGLGDPKKETDIKWESLMWTSKWTHATYEFEFGKEDRKCYVWQRTKQSVFSDQPNMELREKLLTGEMGEVLGVYKGNQGLMWSSRGQFWLSPHLHTEGEIFWSGKQGGEWSELELLALLGALGIIESSRRRSRARRSGGANAAIAGGA